MGTGLLAAGVNGVALVVLTAGAPPKSRPSAPPAASAESSSAPSPAVAEASPAASPSTTPTPTASPTPKPSPTPSLRESMDFVKEKLATFGSYSFEVTAADNPEETGKVTGSTVVRGFDADACVLTLTRKVELKTALGGEPAFKDVRNIELRIPLKEVNRTVSMKPIPARFQGEFEVKGAGSITQLEVTGKGERKPIAVTDDRSTTQDGETRSGRTSDNSATATIYFADEDIAGRSKKALEHAISLCQRRKEAF